MTELNQSYKCNVCGNVVKILQTGIGTLVCCGQPIELIIETMPAAAPEIKIEEMPPVPETITEEKNNPEPAL